MTESRVVAAARVEEDAQYEAGLRPRLLDEYIGQDRIRENLQVAIAAAKRSNEPLITSCCTVHRDWQDDAAYVIANELVQVRATSGPASAAGDLPRHRH